MSNQLTKEELFRQDPDQFVHLSELIIAVKKGLDNPDEIAVFIGEISEFRLRGALGLLKAKTEEHILAVKMQKMQEAKLIKGVQAQQNKSGFRNFLHKGK